MSSRGTGRATLGFPLRLLLAGLISALPAAAQDNPDDARGFNVAQVFNSGGIDHVNVFNGNLVLTIPIGGTYPLAGGLSYGLTLSYNANLWDFDIDCEDPVGEPGEPGDCRITARPNPGFNAGAGWLLSLGRLLPPSTDTNMINRWVYSGADGASHSFYTTLHDGETPEALVRYAGRGLRGAGELRQRNSRGVRFHHPGRRDAAAVPAQQP